MSLADEPSRDYGASLVEIVLAMFLLAMMSLAVIPLLIGSAKVSTENSALAAATSFANAELASLRGEFTNDNDSACADVVARVAERTAAGIKGPPGSGLTGTFTPAPNCSSITAFPGSLRVTITVTGNGATATLSTQILVGTA